MLVHCDEACFGSDLPSRASLPAKFLTAFFTHWEELKYQAWRWLWIFTRENLLPRYCVGGPIVEGLMTKWWQRLLRIKYSGFPWQQGCHPRKEECIGNIQCHLLWLQGKTIYFTPLILYRAQNSTRALFSLWKGIGISEVNPLLPYELTYFGNLKFCSKGCLMGCETLVLE